MRCPFCQHPEDRVVDSRETTEGDAVRRRRECSGCNRRFTTYERIDAVMPMIVKKDGVREIWDRTKVLAGIQKACEKRPVSADAIDRAVDSVARSAQDFGTDEVPSSALGEAVMIALKELDEVAYVRFASVYKSFRDVDEFMSALETLVKERKGSVL